MKYKRKFFTKSASLLLAAALLAGCSPNMAEKPDSTVTPESSQREEEIKNGEASEMTPLEYEVTPETFALSVKNNGEWVSVSLPGETLEVANYVKNEKEAAWEYPDKNISVAIVPTENYLEVSIRSNVQTDQVFDWPIVSGETYYLPLGEGKKIPGDDTIWQEYLNGKEFSAMEQLSMPFWAASFGNQAAMVIMEQPFRSNLMFNEEGTIGFSLRHEYPEIDPEKKSVFRIYLTENNPVSIAKTYKEYVKEQGKFVTLEEKAESNPDIRKLYGAPHIYLWGERLVSPKDINWPEFRKAVDSPEIMQVRKVLTEIEGESGAAEAFKAISAQDYVDEYQKNVICHALSQVLSKNTFYESTVFKKQNDRMEELINKGISNLSQSELIQFNKQVLAANLPEVFQPAEQWMEAETTGLIQDMKNAGINQAWIGLNSWEQAYAKPELAKTAKDAGYLIGPYDSYHSIHEPGNEQWITAKFREAALFETATVINKEGEKESGFQNVGRKLNPVYSMPEVEARLEEITADVDSFNSWFIDCDATGEIYDDYSPEHPTTQQMDLKARLDRMSYIRDKKQMVIGSEGGNDFASTEIAFAHGIELQSFSWMDEDMRGNKESEYYLGKYYSSYGGVPEKFAKPTPLKDKFYQLFLNPQYDVPLYKLVYNDSVITTYHWDWSTFKIEDMAGDRMLRELLYNVPPLYHLDRVEWERYQPAISAHMAVWSPFSSEAVKEEMTDFQYITEDGMVQSSNFGDNLMITANFSDTEYHSGAEKIPAHSAAVTRNGETIIYTP